MHSVHDGNDLMCDGLLHDLWPESRLRCRVHELVVGRALPFHGLEDVLSLLPSVGDSTSGHLGGFIYIIWVS